MPEVAAGQTSMRISVIVPVHNGGEDLRRCLQGLATSTRPPDEVIVVDDGSTDASAAHAVALGARVVTTSAGPRGPAFARNRGAEAATGDVLAFIDADVVVHADTLGRMESVLADEPDVAALFGCYDDEPPVRSPASLYRNLLHHHVHQRGRREAGTFWAGCGAVRRAAFSAAGGFDESYVRPSIEDIELGLRLRQAGQRIRLCREVQATHLKRWTLVNLWRTDIFARAIPWTRLILRHGRLPCDLNLDWRSRIGALTAWLLVGCALLVLGSALLGRATMWPALGLVISTAIMVVLNRDLYAVFFRRGGARFALIAAVLHVGYLLYSSLVFASLLVGHHMRASVGHRREPTSK